MKLKLISLFFLAGLLLQFPACTEDLATDPDQDEREAFLGLWTVEESCVRLNYEVEIKVANDQADKVLMYNFAFTGPGFPPAYGFVDGNKINVPRQTIGEGWKVEGTGTLQSNRKILWEYYIEIGGDGSNCIADYGRP